MIATDGSASGTTDSRLRQLLWSLWAYGRHEILYVCWSLMEVALLAPILLSALSWARYWPAAVFAFWLTTIILLPFNLNRVMTVAGVSVRWQRRIILLAFLLTVLFTLRTLLYEPASLLDFGWLRALLTHFVEPNNPLWSRDLSIFFIVAFLWWRGISLTSRRVEIHDIGLRLRVGGLLVAPFVVGTSLLYGTPVVPFILLFFLSGLLAVALTRAEQIAREEREANYPIKPRWLAVIFITTLLTVLAAAAIALGLSGESVVAWLEPAWEAVRFAVTVVVSTFTYLFFLLLTPLEWLLSFISIRFNLPQLAIDENPLFNFSDQATEADEAMRELSQNDQLIFFWLNRGILLLILAVVVLVLYLAISRFLSERQLAPGSEELGAGPRSSEGKGPGWGERLLRRLNFWQQRRAAASIRRIYHQMTEAAAGSGYPRGSSETPFEYLPILAELWPEGEAETILITRAYVRIRYGELPETQAELDEIKAAWQRLQALGPPE